MKNKKAVQIGADWILLFIVFIAIMIIVSIAVWYFTARPGQLGTYFASAESSLGGLFGEYK